MEISLYKKNLIENCEKNYKQTCSKRKIVNVSWGSERGGGGVHLSVVG